MHFRGNRKVLHLQPPICLVMAELRTSTMHRFVCPSGTALPAHNLPLCTTQFTYQYAVLQDSVHCLLDDRHRKLNQRARGEKTNIKLNINMTSNNCILYFFFLVKYLCCWCLPVGYCPVSEKILQFSASRGLAQMQLTKDKCSSEAHKISLFAVFDD